MIKKKNKRGFTTNLDVDLMEKFREYCFYQKKHQNEVLEELISDLLKKEGVLNGNPDNGR